MIHAQIKSLESRIEAIEQRVELLSQTADHLLQSIERINQEIIPLIERTERQAKQSEALTRQLREQLSVRRAIKILIKRLFMPFGL